MSENHSQEPGRSGKLRKQKKAADGQNKGWEGQVISTTDIPTTWKPPPTSNSEGHVKSGSLFGSNKATYSLKLKSGTKKREENRQKGEAKTTTTTTDEDSSTTIPSDDSKIKHGKNSTSTTKTSTNPDPLKCDIPNSTQPPDIKVNSQSLVDLFDNRSLDVEDQLFRPEAGDGYRSFKFTGFDSEEIRSLGKRFRKLDANSDGMITQEEFVSIPELQSNPLVSRVTDVFDTDKNGTVNFREFVNGMSLFSANSKKHRVGILRFAFRIYDVDNDGFISNGELFQVLKLMVGDNLSDTELQHIVDKTIIYADKDNDNKISFQEFVDVTGGIGYEQKMVLMNL